MNNARATIAAYAAKHDTFGIQAVHAAHPELSIVTYRNVAAQMIRAGELFTRGKKNQVIIYSGVTPIKIHPADNPWATLGYR